MQVSQPQAAAADRDDVNDIFISLLSSSKSLLFIWGQEANDRQEAKEQSLIKKSESQL